VKLTIVAVFAAGVLASVARADEPQHVITNPDWVRVPSAEELMGVFPAGALNSGQSGIAVLSCSVTREGVLTSCAVLTEKPSNAGFGSAALLLANRFLMKPKMVDGKPVDGGSVRIPIRFKTSGLRSGSHQLIPPTAGISILSAAAWDTAPSSAEVAAAYPARAKSETGRVTLACQFVPDGTLKDCLAVTEQPSGQGFATAAKSLAPRFRAIPEMLQDLDLKKTQIQLPIQFSAPDQAQSPRTISQPEWLRTAASDQTQQVFPPKAADAGLKTGRAVLDCAADAHGMMTNCQVVSEDPAGMDFGPAALRVAAVMGVNPWTDEGEPAEGAHVKFAIRLNDKEPAPVAANAAAQPPKAH
jgi:TonB family protein